MSNKVLVIIVVVALFAAAWYMVFQKATTLPVEYNNSVALARDNAEKGIYKKALQNYKDALSIKSDDVDIYLEIADIYLKLGDERGFVNYCEKITKNFPKNQKPYEVLIEYYLRKSEYVKCYDIIRKAKRRKVSSETLNKVENEIKYKYITKTNTYSDVKVFNEGLCPVKIKDKWGYISDTTGTIKISAAYEDAEIFTAGNALVKTEKEMFYIDTNGDKELVPGDSFDYLGTFRTVAVASQNGKYFYVDKNFNKKFGDYDFATNISNQHAAVKKGDKWGLINIEGQETTGFIYDDVKFDEKGNCYRNGVAFIKEKDKYYMIDAAGTKITEKGFDDVVTFAAEEPTAVKIGNLWGFVDNTGTMIIEPRYDDARAFTNGLAPVKIDNAWGYITKDNELVIPAKYEDAKNFTNKGAACVKSNEKWVLIKLCEYVN
jgi:tetratricopeptide (TPR) repeat protein